MISAWRYADLLCVANLLTVSAEWKNVFVPLSVLFIKWYEIMLIGNCHIAQNHVVLMMFVVHNL